MHSTTLEKPIHEERQSSLLFFSMLIAFILAFGIIGTHLMTRTGEINNGAVGGFILAVILAVIVLWSFSRFTVVVTPKELRFGFPIWRKRIPISSARVGEIVRIPFWYGIGIHFIGRTWVYNARLGRGLRISVAKTKYLIGSDNPERLQSTLLQIAKREDGA